MGAEPEGEKPVGAKLEGAEPVNTEPVSAEPEGAEPVGANRCIKPVHQKPVRLGVVDKFDVIGIGVLV